MVLRAAAIWCLSAIYLTCSKVYTTALDNDRVFTSAVVVVGGRARVRADARAAVGARVERGGVPRARVLGPARAASARARLPAPLLATPYTCQLRYPKSLLTAVLHHLLD